MSMKVVSWKITYQKSFENDSSNDGDAITPRSVKLRRGKTAELIRYEKDTQTMQTNKI